MGTKGQHQKPGHIRGIYPNTNRHLVYEDFEKGKHPSELVKKYQRLKKQTLIQYYEDWKKIKRENSMQSVMEDLAGKLHPKPEKKKKPSFLEKEKLLDPEIKEEVQEEDPKTEEKPQSKDFTHTTRKIFHDPFV